MFISLIKKKKKKSAKLVVCLLQPNCSRGLLRTQQLFPSCRAIIESHSALLHLLIQFICVARIIMNHMVHITNHSSTTRAGFAAVP